MFGEIEFWTNEVSYIVCGYVVGLQASSANVHYFTLLYYRLWELLNYW